MFGDHVVEGDGFESSWKDEKDSCNQTVQTTEFKTRDQQTSTTRSTSIQTQTEDNHSDVIESVDMNKLSAWLKTVCPGMMDELKDASISNAMASLKLNDETSNISANMLQQLDVTAGDENLHVSSISWNSTGNTLAVACSFTHETWCHHQGLIYLYTFDRNNTLPESPSKKLNCESCVTSISFHPVQPSTLCAGTISGEIYLWNNQNDEGDNLIAMVAAHDDRISFIQWVLNIDTKKSMSTLATSALDSYLLLWDVSVEDINLTVKQRYTKGKINKSITSPDVFSKKTEGGIIHFDFSPFISGLFILGMEGGALIKCSTLGAKSLLADGEASIFDPSVNNYERHEGEITSIKFSPHRKELFISCGTDNEIRVFHIDQVTPTQIIFMEVELNAVSWVIHEPKLLIGCGEKGSIRLFSLLNGQAIPHANTNSTEPFTQLAINEKRMNVIAFGNTKGQVQLWTMPWHNIATQDYSNVYG